MVAVLISICTFSFLQANAGAEEVGFSIREIQSPYQVDKRLSYFDLKVKPAQKFELKVEVQNLSKKTATFNVAATNAMTSNNGVIDYGKTKEQLDQSMTMPFTSLAKVDEPQITLTGRSTKIVTMQVTMPNRKFYGMILGGFYVEKAIPEDQQKSGYTNQYAYAKGVVLRENNKTVQPTLDMPAVSVKVINNLVYVAGTIRNPKMTNVKGLKMEATITKKGDTKIIESKEVSNYSVAPNTNFDATFQYNKQKLPAGKYTFHVNATQTKGVKHSWNFEKDFVIDKDEIKKLTNDSSGLEIKAKQNIMLYVLLGIVAALFVIVLFLLWLILARKRRKKDEE